MSSAMGVTIAKRRLSEVEIETLVEETRKSPHIGLIKPNVWKQFPITYMAKSSGKLLGVCAIIPLKSWAKIGPVVVLSQHQKQGVGSLLLEKVNRDFLTKNLYIGSSNVGIQKIVVRLGFKPVGFWQLTREVKSHLLGYLFQRWSFDYLVDALIKRIKTKRGRYCFFVRTYSSI